MGDSPVISSSLLNNSHLSIDEAIHLEKVKFAFTVRDYLTKKARIDPSKVEWLVEYNQED